MTTCSQRERFRYGESSSKKVQPAPAKRGTEACHDLSCAALAQTEEFLDRRAVEVSGCHRTQGAEDFIKSMKPNRLGRHSGLLPSTIR